MSNFKKSFRGYNVSDVDERIKELEAKLSESERKREEQNARICDVENALDASKVLAEHYKTEYERLKTEYDFLSAKEDSHTNMLESVGRIYVKAYESGREIADAPITHIDSLMERLCRTFNEVGERCVNSQEIYDEVYSRVRTIVGEINALTEGVVNSIEDIGLHLEKVKAVCNEIGDIKVATSEDVERIKLSYCESVNDYISPDPVQNDNTETESRDICDDEENNGKAENDAVNDLPDPHEKTEASEETEERQGDMTAAPDTENTAEDFITESEKFHEDSAGQTSYDPANDGSKETHREQYIFHLLSKYQKSSKN